MVENIKSIRLDQLPEPADRFHLDKIIGYGAFGKVYEATDTHSDGNKRVAIKTLNFDTSFMHYFNEEYRVLKALHQHTLLPDFFGAYLKKADGSDKDKLWFIMEICEGGSVLELVKNMQIAEKEMSEEHVAYILKETVNGLVYLHENNVTHGDVRGSNILLTKNGEVKLAGFGFSKSTDSPDEKHNKCEGSPAWMAPEVAACMQEDGSYDNKIDVWALGITAIELAEGESPFQNIHPSRALFQILRNPPPTLFRSEKWSEMFNDFISECLHKNPEYRPCMMEIAEHPFLIDIPENSYHLSQELKTLSENFKSERTNPQEITLRNSMLYAGQDEPPESMLVEDLAALDNITEERILNEIEERYKQGRYFTFVGDVLLAVNCNQNCIFNPEEQSKYVFKARSDNAPHIYAVADKAYQDVLHHEEPQFIILSGETLSGKTACFKYLLSHLNFLSDNENKMGTRIQTAVDILHAVGNAETPVNPNSTRHILKLELTFTGTGKLSGAIFWIYQLEKWRVSTSDNAQANFHLFYYFYDAMKANDKLEQYGLQSDTKYRYLRGRGEDCKSVRGPANEELDKNEKKFSEFMQNMEILGFTLDQLETLNKLIAAIILLGEIKFEYSEEEIIQVRNIETASTVAKHLSVEEKKLIWALTNYCVIDNEIAKKKHHTKKEAENARDVFAAGLYSRIVDWIINNINLQLSLPRALLGDKYSINIMDYFGFECFEKNGLEQLFVNTLNEQLQYHYVQRVFAWEMQEQEEEEIPLQPLSFYDNKPTVDELLQRPDGLFYLIDETTHTGSEFKAVIDALTNKASGTRIRKKSDNEFQVAHYTGKVVYNINEMVEKNFDFIPPEMIDTMRLSSDHTIQSLFISRLTRTGNLTLNTSEKNIILSKSGQKWETTLALQNKAKIKKFNTESRGQYSQTRQMRTAATTFRATSLDILKSLAIGAGNGGTHFVRCIRANLKGEPSNFHRNIVLQQLRALTILDTARARQKGYPHRIPFSEFIRRYKFLAFDFNEAVDVTKDNSRLLLVRLKMEGWVIGKSKVFLTYYNEEYLSRLYETQVKKIIKVQTMIRVFLAKRNFASKLLKGRRDCGKYVT